MTSDNLTLLTPEILDEGYTDSSEVYSLIYSLPSPANCVEFNGNLIAVGHNDGVSILTPIPSDSSISKAHPSKFQQEWVFQVTSVQKIKPNVSCIKFTSKYLILGHEDYSISVINHLDPQEITKGGINLVGHSDFINSIDVLDNGNTIVSASDDKTVRVWDVSTGEETHLFQIDAIPTLVKFWIDSDYDKLIIVENDNVVKVLNYKSSVWDCAIYPIPYSLNSDNSIKDVLVNDDGNLTVIGDSGWLKEYNLLTLRGGSGYTYPLNEAQLSGWITSNAKYITSAHNLIGSIGHERSSFIDLKSSSSSKEVVQFKLTLPSLSIQDGAINKDGVVAVLSGVKLVLLRPFDSYEALQYV